MTLSLAISIIGFPSVFAILAAAWHKITVIQRAYQISVRDRLMQIYHKAVDNNCISDDDAEMFEALYQAYHALGPNGVMDSRRDQIQKMTKVHEYPKYIKRDIDDGK